MRAAMVLAGAWVLGSTLAGCTVLPSTARRGLITGGGAVVGAGVGHALGDKKPGWTLAGAGAGALVTALSLGRDPELAQASFDDGYIQGQADSIKRQYFLRQAREAQPTESAQGRTVHYVVPGPTVTVDGRKLEPHTVTVSVTE